MPRRSSIFRRRGGRSGGGRPLWQWLAAGELSVRDVVKLVTPDPQPETPTLTAEGIRERRREKSKKERREKRQNRRRKRSKASPHPNTPPVEPDAAQAKPELTDAQRMRLESVGGSVLEDGSIWLPIETAGHVSGPTSAASPPSWRTY